jgi:hypothetical protein
LLGETMMREMAARLVNWERYESELN